MFFGPQKILTRVRLQKGLHAQWRQPNIYCRIVSASVTQTGLREFFQVGNPHPSARLGALCRARLLVTRTRANVESVASRQRVSSTALLWWSRQMEHAASFTYTCCHRHSELAAPCSVIRTPTTLNQERCLVYGGKGNHHD